MEDREPDESLSGVVTSEFLNKCIFSGRYNEEEKIDDM